MHRHDPASALRNLIRAVPVFISLQALGACSGSNPTAPTPGNAGASAAGAPGGAGASEAGVAGSGFAAGSGATAGSELPPPGGSGGTVLPAGGTTAMSGSGAGGAFAGGGGASAGGSTGQAGGSGAPSATYNHRVLLGSGTGLIAIVSDDGSKFEWQINFKPFGRAGSETEGNDAVMLPNGDIAFTFSAGAQEVKPADDSVVWRFDNPAGSETQGITPVENGHFIVAETHSGGLAYLHELDAMGHKVSTITVMSGTGAGFHQQFRAVRKTPQGTYLVTYLGGDMAREIDSSGKTVREFTKAKMECGAFVAVRLPDLNTLISCGSDRRVIEVDPQDKIVWEANAKNVPFMNAFIAGIQRLPNGNTAMCNFFGEIGHDPGTPKCFEVTKNFKVVWQLKDPKTGTNWWTALEYLDPNAWVGGVPLR